MKEGRRKYKEEDIEEDKAAEKGYQYSQKDKERTNWYTQRG